jgi:hypothetical protein
LRNNVTKLNLKFKGNAMKTIQVAAFAVNAALYVVLGVLLSSVAPIYFGGVRFWPQVIVPAVFAAVFGPWVGGFGAAVGIFISDVSLGGSPLLSLMAGITSNFVGFWLIGYIANKKVNIKNSTVIFTAITVICAAIAYLYASVLAIGVILGCYVVFLVVVWRGKKYVSYELGSVVGLLVGSLIIGIMVPVYAVLFAPTVTTLPGLTAAGILGLFTWTFATEIPFLLILGPPILEAINRAFPTLRSQTTKTKPTTSEP